jgi:thiol-disulfide isomerase/thioredoxin
MRDDGRFSMRRSLVLFLGGALLALLACENAGEAAAAPAGTQADSDSLFQGFVPTGDFQLEVGGKVIEGAGIFLNQKVPAYLFLTTELSSPVLLLPRTGAVQTVSILKVAKRPDGSVDLLADAAFAPAGRFALEEGNVSFDFDGKRFFLKEKPPLLGLKSLDELLAYSADYGRLAREYAPAADALGVLAKETRDVKVRVFFGTWCPFCSRYLPRLLRVEEELDSSRVVIDYYGLPHDISSDPLAKQMKVSSVPTGVVYVNGKEVGRINGDAWQAPEKAIQRLIGS